MTSHSEGSQNAPKMRPRAFRLERNETANAASSEMIGEYRAAGGAQVMAAPDVFAAADTAMLEPGERAIEAAQRRGILRAGVFSWSGLFWSAISGLATLALGVWITSFIDSLFARSQMLGWTGLVLGGLAALAVAMGLAREIYAIIRQREIAHLHVALARARIEDDQPAAREHVAQLLHLYEKRPQTARARASVRALLTEIVDGRDLIEIAERNLMAPLDAAARKEIARAAKRVSLMTALAPRAIVDVLFVAAQAVRLIRNISQIYGGRPGLLGFLKLTRSIGAHLAISGGMAVGDSLAQQVFGHGIVAKISARLGEGVLNGMLTARIGLSAMAVCRPMPFAAIKAPGVSDVAPFLFGEDRMKTEAAK